MRHLTVIHFLKGHREGATSDMPRLQHLREHFVSGCAVAVRRCLEPLQSRSTLRRAAGATTFQNRDVLPVPIKLISIGKQERGPAEELAEEWSKKLRRYVALDCVRLKGNPKKSSAPELHIKTEGAQVLKSLDARDYVVILDERGKQFTSFDFAHTLAAAGDKSSRSIVFCIGGPYGHSEEVRNRANQVVSLSACVLNHQIAKLVLLEQLYRAWTIIRREPYHH